MPQPNLNRRIYQQENSREKLYLIANSSSIAIYLSPKKEDLICLTLYYTFVYLSS